MKKIAKFIRATLAGGVLFLIPMAVLVIATAKILSVLRDIARPLADKISFKQVWGVGVITLISIFFLLIICLAAGLFMRTKFAQRIKKYVEDHVLVFIPGYSYLRAVSEDRLSTDKTDSWKPATIIIDDNHVICFVTEESENYCSLFLPDAPSPSSGSVCVREKSDVKFLTINVPEAIALIRQLGKGGTLVFEKMGAAVHNN